ncbi:MAG: hypothetical protein ACI9HK_005486, partial [Pirellulaceae bacterium]
TPCKATPCKATPCKATPCKATPCKATPCKADIGFCEIDEDLEAARCSIQRAVPFALTQHDFHCFCCFLWRCFPAELAGFSCGAAGGAIEVQHASRFNNRRQACSVDCKGDIELNTPLLGTLCGYRGHCLTPIAFNSTLALTSTVQTNDHTVDVSGELRAGFRLFVKDSM